MTTTATESNDNKVSGDVLKLKHPFQVNGTEYKELTLDFDSLTAQDQMQAERTYRIIYGNDSPEPVPAADSRFLLILAGMAAKVNHEDLLIHLKGRDYRRMVNRALVFCGGPED